MELPGRRKGQGTLPEGEGSLQLTTTLKYLVMKNNNIKFSLEKIFSIGGQRY